MVGRVRDTIVKLIAFIDSTGSHHRVEAQAHSGNPAQHHRATATTKQAIVATFVIRRMNDPSFDFATCVNGTSNTVIDHGRFADDIHLSGDNSRPITNKPSSQLSSRGVCSMKSSSSYTYRQCTIPSERAGGAGLTAHDEGQTSAPLQNRPSEHRAGVGVWTTMASWLSRRRW